jgi:hypothetical protein
LPGRFELDTTATRSHPALLAGPVELHVRLLQRVKKGQLLATIRPPALRERQHELHKAEHDVRRSSEELAIATAQLQASRRRITFLDKRIKHLGAAGVSRAALDGQLLSLRDALPAASARVASARAEVSRERHHKRVLLLALSEISGRQVAELVKPATDKDAANAHGVATSKSPDKPDDGHAHDDTPLWDGLSSLELRAQHNGMVTAIGAAQGAWAAQGVAVVEVTDDTALRFVARALQSDTARLVDGAGALVVPPRRYLAARRGEKPRPYQGLPGTITLGINATPGLPTMPVVVHATSRVPWARAGLSSVVEVIVAGSSEPEVAVPLAAVVRDGLSDVLFRRDPTDPDKVIRVEPELGPDDGTWIVVYSDVNSGDEIVVDGAYELKLASGQKPTVKGHFHADGTFHAAEEHP